MNQDPNSQESRGVSATGVVAAILISIPGFVCQYAVLAWRTSWGIGDIVITIPLFAGTLIAALSVAFCITVAVLGGRAVFWRTMAAVFAGIQLASLYATWHHVLNQPKQPVGP